MKYVDIKVWNDLPLKGTEKSSHSWSLVLHVELESAWFSSMANKFLKFILAASHSSIMLNRSGRMFPSSMLFYCYARNSILDPFSVGTLFFFYFLVFFPCIWRSPTPLERVTITFFNYNGENIQFGHRVLKCVDW